MATYAVTVPLELEEKIKALIVQAMNEIAVSNGLPIPTDIDVDISTKTRDGGQLDIELTGTASTTDPIRKAEADRLMEAVRAEAALYFARTKGITDPRFEITHEKWIDCWSFNPYDEKLGRAVGGLKLMDTLEETLEWLRAANATAGVKSE